MIRLFRDTPIRRKLTLITMLSSGLALLLACASFVWYEQVAYRKILSGRMVATAGIVGDNCASALTFDEPDAARVALESLRHQPAIIGAAIYDKTGSVFATYGKTGDFTPPPHKPRGQKIGLDHADQFRDIVFDGEVIGGIFLRYGMTDLKELQRHYVAIAAAVLVGASLLSLLISSQLQRSISEPVGALADVVGRVARDKDFTVRALRSGSDELGLLIDGFNEMLNQIQQRDIMLKIAQDSLESRVRERTAELDGSLAVLNATLDSTADGILAVNTKGKAVSYNTKFAVMWSIPAAMLERADHEEMLRFQVGQVADSEGFIDEMKRIYQTCCRSGARTVHLRDGRVFERFTKEQRIEGEIVGMVINYRDVTERKRAEAELVAAHQQLLATSHQAGMSEVATNVLHNVGNVLNSVNVSCSVISDMVRKSRVSSVAKTAELLRLHEPDLPGFFSSDPSGKKLPGFLSSLAGRLATERATMLEELRLLGKNIGHIKDIVAVQQNYAKNLGGVRETLPLQGLVEDALRMNDGSLARHHIEIIREFDDAPPIPLEKHKVLQILVNLLRNAKHALTDSEREDKRLVVRIASQDGKIAVSIGDNGIGIEPENLTRIFAHGFTTRKEGHGFGLHSGVLAARDMGGSLTATSPGPGQGATFTLELPIGDPELSQKS